MANVARIKNDSAISIILIRHGETSENQKGNWAGITDFPITEDAAETLIKYRQQYNYPKCEAIFCSPLTRCKQTAQIIYPDKKAVILNELIEMNFGSCEGLNAFESAKKYGIKAIENKQLNFRFPKGESFYECLQRAVIAFDLVVQYSVENTCFSIAIFTHAMLISVFLKYCVLQELTNDQQFCPNGMGVQIELFPNEWFKNRLASFCGFVPSNAQRPNFKDSKYRLSE